MKFSSRSHAPLFGGILLCALALSPTAFAKDKNTNDLIESTEGTTATEVAALKPLPAPSQTKVAVLPFAATSSDASHVRIGTGANWLLFQHEGFQMIPLKDSIEALKKDGDVEPGLPLRKADALRIGKALGADWVVYGEVKELRPYKKESFFKTSKLMWASMRLAVADVGKDDLMFWQVRSRRIGGTGFGGGNYKSGESLARTGVLSVSSQALEPLMEALPAHEVKGDKPDTGDLAGFVKETWGAER